MDQLKVSRLDNQRQLGHILMVRQTLKRERSRWRRTVTEEAQEYARSEGYIATRRSQRQLSAMKNRNIIFSSSDEGRIIRFAL